MSVTEMHGVHDTLAHLLVPLDTLMPHPDNPREHDEDVIRESLVLNGQYGPIVVQKSSNRVLAGNGTYAAAMSLGWTHIAAVLLDVDDDAALRVLLADNRINESGGNDPEALLALLRDLEGQFGGTGYSATDFSELLSMVDQTLGEVGDGLADLEPSQISDLRSLTVNYATADFSRLVQQLMDLREDEGESFTEVVLRLVHEALLRR